MPEATRPVGRAQQPDEPTASPRHEGHERPASGGNPQPASEALQELQGGVVATAAASGFAAAAAGGGAGDEVAIDGGMGIVTMMGLADAGWEPGARYVSNSSTHTQVS